MQGRAPADEDASTAAAEPTLGRMSADERSRSRTSIMRAAAEGDPMRYCQGILQVVNCIYAAACGEIPWEQTLAEICQVGRLDGCALSMVDQVARRRVVAAAYGLSFAAAADAMPAPIPRDSRLTDGVLGSAPGAIWQAPQVVADAPPAAVSFWTDRMRPDGSISWACLVVDREDREVVCLEVSAGAGRPASSPELVDFLRQLAPHLTRAWRIGKAGRILATPSRLGSGADSSPDPAPAPDLAGLPEARLRAEFGLTKAEARLALRLAEGASLASAAQAFNVKLTTIRSQLQQVFAKTGTCRQTELVALILSRGYGIRGVPWRPAKRERQAPASRSLDL
jgi:DNA-binding CsgD family transcriptional regulator